MTYGRRTLLHRAATFAAVAAVSSCAGATTPAAKRIPRVGVLNFPDTALRHHFQSGLREFGYEDRSTIRIEWRDANEETINPIAAELVASAVDVVVANGDLAQRAAKRATSTIPIVIVLGTDPVQAGLVQSLAWPGGNITGIAGVAGILNGKRLELLKEVVPSISRVAIVSDDAAPRKASREDAERAARALGLEVVTVEVRDVSGLPSALDAAAQRHVEALLVLFIAGARDSPDPHTLAFAAGRRIPAVYGSFLYADAGGLLVFVEDQSLIFRRAGNYVARILDGASPSDMPVEQPTGFHLIINLKTARKLGLTIPQSLLSRATRVIDE